MKGKYSIGYNDKNNDFIKVWENGYTKKFEKIEEAEQYIQEKLEEQYVNTEKPIKIMKGWEVIKEVRK